MTSERPAGHGFVLWNGRVLVRSAEQPSLVIVTGEALSERAGVVPVFAHAGERIIGYILQADDADRAYAALGPIAPGAVFIEMMTELGRYEADVRAAIVRGIALERWSNRYRFCPADGSALGWTSDYGSKICTNPQRVHRHFPRLDPAIIVLVTCGNRALLGRSHRYPAGFYSTLAGFVEPGESLEAALRREVYEEAGIRVGATRYFGSEPWPFPRSLMLGFFADALTETIALRDAELEDARWFNVVELHELAARMKTARPFFDTIARRLIDAWLAERTGSRARDLRC